MESSPKPADAASAAPKKRGKGMWIAIAAVVVIVVVVLAVYFSMGPTVNVSIVDDGKCTTIGTPACAFSPASYSSTGRTVTWKNNGGIDHTVNFFANSTATPPGNSGNLAAGATFAATFGAAGTYYYYCSIHGWMKGTVVLS